MPTLRNRKKLWARMGKGSQKRRLAKIARRRAKKELVNG